jgi:RimJ/RimL family protein N-acetyltransferase
MALPDPRRAIAGTPRVLLREFTPADADDLFALDSDPDVMRYIGDGRIGTREDVATQLPRAIRRYSDHPGLGSWHATLRESGQFIGWVSLKHAGDSPDIEIGYRLCVQAWGKGLATELASSMVVRGFEKVGLQRIIGVTHPDNRASQNVLRKIGMRDQGFGRYYEQDLRLFAITSEEWLAQGRGRAGR